MAVKYRHIRFGFKETARSIFKNETYIQAEDTCVKQIQRVFWADSSGSHKKLEKSFMFLKATESGGETFWIGMLLSLFKVKAKHYWKKKEEKLEPVQYKEGTEPTD